MWLVPARANVAAFEQWVVDMFRHEWQLAGHEDPLHSIAIVDENPLYQGQTTNFRTPGGRFAPVYSRVDASGRVPG